MIVPGWHPLVVHFPLALIMSGAVALTLTRWVKAERAAAALATWGTWNFCLGAVLVYAALGTGLAAAIGLHVDAAARVAIGRHVKAAVVATLLVTLSAVWRGAGTAPASRPSNVFLVLLWAATLSIAVTGYRGGQNVFVHGIGLRLDAETPSP
jgi:uncharacterized membrane protein